MLNWARINFEIHDPALAARLQKHAQATASGSIEQALQRLLETQEEQDRWLAENRSAINEKIGRGINQLERAEGIPEDQMDTHLAKRKARRE